LFKLKYPGYEFKLSISLDSRFILGKLFDTISGGSKSCILKVWDANTGNEIQTFESMILKPAYMSADGKYIVSRFNQQIIKVWDAKTGTELYSLETESVHIADVVITQNNEFIVASDNCVLKLWNISTGNLIRNFQGHTEKVTCFSVSNNSEFIFSGSEDKSIRKWDLRTGKELTIMKAHIFPLEFIKISPNDKFIISTAAYIEVFMWDTSGNKIAKLVAPGKLGQTDGIFKCTITTNSNFIAINYSNQTNIIWDARLNQDLFEIDGGQESLILDSGLIIFDRVTRTPMKLQFVNI